MYGFKDAAIISVLEWQTKRLKRVLRGDSLPGVVYAKVVLRYVIEFCYASMSCQLVKAVWSRYKADGIYLKEIFTLDGQRAFVQHTGTERTSNVPEGMDGEEDNRDVECTVTAEEAATSGIRNKLREVQRVCDDSGEAVPTTIVEVVELAREGINAKRKNA